MREKEENADDRTLGIRGRRPSGSGAAFLPLGLREPGSRATSHADPMRIPGPVPRSYRHGRSFRLNNSHRQCLAFGWLPGLPPHLKLDRCSNKFSTQKNCLSLLVPLETRGMNPSARRTSSLSLTHSCCSCFGTPIRADLAI